MNADDILTEREHQGPVSTGSLEHGMLRPRQVLKLFARILAALVLLAMALLCVFGFLASFEPGNGLIWKVGYGVLDCGFLLGALALVRGDIANRAVPED
jgi:hypothetical protein